MTPYRFALVALVVALLMCCAGAVQLLNGGSVALNAAFKSETFPLER